MAKKGILQDLFSASANLRRLNVSLSVTRELSMVQSFMDAMEPATHTLEALRSSQESLLAWMEEWKR